MKLDNTICFTGHRCQKLPWLFNEEDGRCKAMKVTLRFEIEKAIQRGYRTFLCGMQIKKRDITKNMFRFFNEKDYFFVVAMFFVIIKLQKD